MLRSPSGGIESTERGGDDVCCPLDRVIDSVRYRDEFLNVGIVALTIAKERNRTNATRIANMEIPNSINPEDVLVPVKGRGTNLSVCFEELMYLFPSP